MNSYFGPDPTKWSDTVVGVCGVFNRSNDIEDATFQAEMEALMPAWINAASGDDICDPELEGYSVAVASTHPCLELFSAMHCDPPPTNRFPNCT
jgi:hypothetical protein